MRKPIPRSILLMSSSGTKVNHQTITCSNIAEQLIEKGLATALRHKRDDENRSPDYDKLTTAEQAATAEARGVHSGKNDPLPRIGNASEVSSHLL